MFNIKSISRTSKKNTVNTTLYVLKVKFLESSQLLLFTKIQCEKLLNIAIANTIAFSDVKRKTKVKLCL